MDYLTIRVYHVPMHSHDHHMHGSARQKPRGSSCCHVHAPEEGESGDGHSHRGGDWLLRATLVIVVAAYATHVFGRGIALPSQVEAFAKASFELMNAMWWGVVAGIFFVGLMGRVPREFIMKILGKGGSVGGILRACLGGVLLDLCSHGILLVAMKLYERGASIGQVMAFLISSPWNSFSLTLILVALIGVKWTLLFIALSMLIAFTSGLLFESLVKRGALPTNPNQSDMPEDFRFFAEARRQLKQVRWSPALLWDMLREGFRDSSAVLRWVFLGVVLAALVKALIPDAHFAHYFGATLGGLFLTMLAATVIEVCSEGTTPIAADILTRAAAPGNAFGFLMAGVATDYTEIMALRETTKSWKIALFLPLVTLPQVFVISYIINTLAK